MMQPLSESLKIFARFCPSFVDGVRSAPCDNLELTVSKTGAPNLKKQLAGEPFYFHSNEDPLLEAKFWFESFPSIENAEGLIIFGIGLGYYFFAAKDWLEKNPERFMVFIEPDFAVLKLLFSSDAGREIIAHPQVVILGMDLSSTQGENETFKYFQVASLLLYSSLSFFSELKCYETIYQDSWKMAKKIIQIQMKIKRIVTTFFRKSDFDSRISNNLMNLWVACSSKLLYGMEGCLKGVPAVICGAGPSLVNDLSILENYASSLLLLGAGSGLNVLNQHHIFPQLGIGIDPHDTSRSRILTNTSFMTPFCFQLGFNFQALEILHGTKIFFRGIDHYGMDCWFEKHLGIDGYPRIKGSVSSTDVCVKIAKFLGCSPVVLLGVDLSYTDKKRYPDEVHIHPVDPEKEKNQLTFIQVKEQIPIKGIGGETVFSKMDWIKEGSGYSAIARASPEMKIINATSRGLLLSDIEHKPLGEVAEEYFKFKVDVDNLIYAEIQNCEEVSASQSKLRELINLWNDSLDSCNEVILQILSEFSSLLKKYEENSEFSERCKTERYLILRSQLEKEEAFHHFLRSIFSDYQDIFFREAYPFLYRRELLKEREGNLKELRHFVKQYTFLANILLLVKKHVEDCLSKNNLSPLVPDFIKPLQAVDSCQPFGRDAFERGRFVLQDEEDWALWNQEFSPVYLDQAENVEKNGVFAYVLGKTGSADGQCVISYPDGETKGECFYREGELHGPSTFYTREGKVLAVGWFIEGKRAGKNYQYYLSGKLYSIKRFKEGMPCGSHQYFYETGQPQANIHFSKGKLHGEVRLFFPNGRIRREVHFENGKLHGRERFWWENGQLMLESEFHAGIPVGLSQMWNEHGQLMRSLKFYDSEEHRDLTVWNEAGEVITQENYMPTALSKEVLKKSEEVSEEIKKVQESLKRLFNQTPKE